MDEQVIGVGIISEISADSPMILWKHRNRQPGGRGRRNCRGSGCAVPRRLTQMTLARNADGGLGQAIMGQTHKPQNALMYQNRKIINTTKHIPKKLDVK